MSAAKKLANKSPALDAPIPLLLHIGRYWRRATDAPRWIMPQLRDSAKKDSI